MYLVDLITQTFYFSREILIVFSDSCDLGAWALDIWMASEAERFVFLWMRGSYKSSVLIVCPLLIMFLPFLISVLPF